MNGYDPMSLHMEIMQLRSELSEVAAVAHDARDVVQLAAPVVMPDDASPRPFDIKTEADGRTTVVRCSFYYGGRMRTVEDADIRMEGSVWLVAESGDGDSEPAFSVTQEDPGENARAVRLYDFDEHGNVAVDYRSVFVALDAEESSESGSESSEEFVVSLNGLSGRVEVVADEGTVSIGDVDLSISVETNDDGKIRISLSGPGDESADESGDPCVHPGSHGEGGVPADYTDAHGFGPGIGSEGDGGIPADDNHGMAIGKPCNCD